MSFTVLQIYKKFFELLLKKVKKIALYAQKNYFLTKKEPKLLFPQYNFLSFLLTLQFLKYMTISYLISFRVATQNFFGVTVNNVNSMKSKYPISATSLLGSGTKISDDDQKI